MLSLIKNQTDLSKLSNDDLQELYRYLENYRIRYRKKLNIPIENSFGVEIEFDKIPLIFVSDITYDYEEYQYWSAHADNSVSDYQNGILIGGEISSDILHDTEEDWHLLSNMFYYLKNLGAKATDKTSFHIHVGAQIFKEDLKYLKRFIKVWCVFEDIIFRFGYGKNEEYRPQIMEFAPPIAPLYYNYYQKNSKLFDWFETTKMFDFGKKRAVNFKNYHYLSSEEEVNNTIEIRCANGTMQSYIAQNNVNFFLKLMLYVTSDRYDEKLIDSLFHSMKVKKIEEYSVLDIKKAMLLSDLIFINSLDKLNFLKQYVKKDVRLLIRN